MNELDLFAAAIGIADPVERKALLNRECAGQSDLRRRLDLLLDAHGRSDPLLDVHSPGDPHATATFVPESAQIGTVIAGRYKLLEQIGEGGMGTVWMAEQREPVKRLVAVKLIKAGMDSKAVLARFEAERQALALMDHPNIAKVLDGGTIADGRPFFVMELVKGLPLTEYCDARKLSVDDRLNVFVATCSAVQHAHQKAVIHRDLKPSNILVTEHDGKPMPKVIDFGLAKALNPANLLTDRTLHTAYGAVIGTPLYMAPEQVGINALDVDTRTDIYALGAILYELLTGTTPLEKQRFKEAAWEEVKRLIREEEPPVPSKRLSTSEARPSLSANRNSEPLKLTRALRGELDWIVMKALEKNRTRRYETANGLAMDVQRYLGGESVLAVPPSTAYQLRKFVRRNRALLTTAAAIALMLVVGIAGTTYGMIRANHSAEAERLAKIDAEEQKEKATQSAERESAARQKAEAAEKEARAKEAEAEAVVTFFQDRVFAAGRPKGEQGGLGHDVSLHDAITASLPALATSFRDQPLVEARLRFALGGTFFYLGEYSRAADQYEQARVVHLRLHGPDHPDTLSCRNSVANCYYFLGRHADALKMYEQTLDIRKRVLPPDHPDILISMSNLASSYFALGRHDEALKLREETLAIEKRVLPPDDPGILGSMNNLATSYTGVGRHDDALKLNQETLAIRKRVFPPDHPDTLKTISGLANSYSGLGRHAEALKLNQETLEIRKRVLPPGHSDILTSMMNLSANLAALNRHDESVKVFEETVAIMKRVLLPEHRVTLGNMTYLANRYTALSRHAEALKLNQDTLEIRKRVLPPDHPDTVLNTANLANSYEALNRHAEAIPPLDAMIKLLKQKEPTDPVSLYNIACFHARIATLQAKAGDADAARLPKDDADQAMEWLKKAVAAGWKDVAQIMKDSDLDSLRDRDDFKRLLVELEAGLPPRSPEEK